MKYVALLRGINLGGRTLAMADLRRYLGELGFEDVRTLQAAGNAAFEADEKSAAKLTSAIEKKLVDECGFSVSVLLRTQAELRRLVDGKPFKGVATAKGTRLFVSFLRDKPAAGAKPPEDPNGEWRVWASEREVFGVVPEGARTVDIMALIEKAFGKDLTTRNWNTVEKLAQM